jgi:hypothetical protein
LPSNHADSAAACQHVLVTRQRLCQDATGQFAGHTRQSDGGKRGAEASGGESRIDFTYVFEPISRMFRCQIDERETQFSSVRQLLQSERDARSQLQDEVAGACCAIRRRS